MKKVLFSVCALAALLTGCAKSDVVDAPNFETPITFEAYSGKVPVSKATSIDDGADLSEEGGFAVYAFNTTTTDNETYTPDWESLYFNETLSLSGNSWVFDVKEGNTTPNVYYWPSDGNALAFVAYSNNGGSAYVAPADGNVPSLTVTVPDAVADQKDVMVATYVQTKSESDTPEAVNLVFHHVLSRIYFQLTSDRTITVESLKVNGNFYSTGSVSLYPREEDTETGELVVVDPAIATSGEPNVTSYEFITGEAFSLETTTGTSTEKIIDNTDDSVDDYYMMLIPGTPSTVEVIYYFEEDEANKYIATATLNDDLTAEDAFKFEKGKSYLFDLVLKSKAISFTADVDGWDEAHNNSSIGTSDTSFEFVSERYTEGGNSGDENQNGENQDDENQNENA